MVTNKQNDVRHMGDIIEIKLERRNGNIKWCLIDNEDYEKIKEYRWNCLPNNYVTTNIKFNGVYKMIRIHSLIMDNVRTGKIIDHLNGNPLDNRKCNLRICTSSENVQNKSVYKENRVFTGVHYREDCRKYNSVIRCDGILYSLGYYTDQIDAAIAYDVAAIKLFGNFAHLNFLNNGDVVPEYITRNVQQGLTKSFKETCSSKYRGVYYLKSKNRWRCCIRIGKTIKVIGSFDNEIDAAKAFNEYVLLNDLKRKLNDV